MPSVPPWSRNQRARKQTLVSRPWAGLLEAALWRDGRHVSRNLPQISDWIGAAKFAVAIGSGDCNDLAVKDLPVARVYFAAIAAVGAGTDVAW